MREPRRRIAAAAVIAAFATFVVASQARADTQERARAEAPMSLNDALARGANRGPEVAVAAAPRVASRSAQDASRTWLVLPPTVSVGAGPRSDASTLTLDLQASATVLVPLRGVRGARGDVARASIDLVTADTRRARFDDALRAGLAWTRTVEAKQVLRLRREALQQAEAIAQTGKKRAQAGVAMPSELAVVLGDLGFARASVLDAEGALVEAVAELRLATGAAADAPVDVAGDLDAEASRPAEAPPASTASRAVADASPTVRVADAREVVARGETRLTTATLGPSLGFGASYMHEGTGATSVLGVVTLPLPIVDHAAFDRARGDAVQASAAAQTARARAEVASRLALALHDIEHSRETRSILVTDALPPLREALRLATVQFAAGTEDVSFVLVARQRLIAAEEMLTRVSGDVVRADLKLAHVTGTLLHEVP